MAKPPSLRRRVGRKVVRGLVTPLHLRRRHRPIVAGQAGSTPGLTAEQLAQLKRRAPVRVVRTDYNRAEVRVQETVQDEPPVLPPRADLHEPDRGEQDPDSEHAIRSWITLDGLGDPAALAEVSAAFGVHPLAMEDVVNVPQRAKAELYGSARSSQMPLLVVARLIDFEGEKLRVEQVSLLVGPNAVVSVLEKASPVFDLVRERIGTDGSRLRRYGIGFLMYALLDSIVDRYTPVIEHYAERILDLEDEVLFRPEEDTIQHIHAIKRDLMLLRREVVPMRTMLRELSELETPLMDDTTLTFLRDVIDHCVSSVDAIDSQREAAVALADTWMNAMSTRMNEVMKVLTIIASLFIPASFLAGVFGMNFQWVPLLDQKYGFVIFVGLCGGLTVAMLGWFRWKGWLR